MPISRSRLIEEQHGASLVEVLLAVAISGLVLGAAGMALPRFMVDSRLSTTEGQLKAIANRARMRALAEQRPVRLTMTGASVRLTPALDRNDVIETGQIEMTIISGLRTGGAAVVVFLPDGSSSGARIEVKDSRQTRHFEIDWATGRIISDGR